MWSRIYPIGYLGSYKYVVIFARYSGKWLFVRHAQRDTWETAGGHIEPGETPEQAARRELWEETGAEKYALRAVMDYRAGDEKGEANGVIFLANVETLGEMPGFEMAERLLTDALPEKLTYPGITPVLYREIEKREGFGMLRVAMLSKWHVHAAGYARFLSACEDVQITCVWDEEVERGEQWAKELEVPFVACLDDVLAREDVDAVIIDSPTNMHKEIMIKAARAGKHIFTEKCMCLTVADCDEVIAEIEKSGVKFTISYPQRCLAKNLTVKRLIDSGVLGDITVVRLRNAHDGASRGWLPERWYDPITTGGGAMMDLGAHPMYLARWLLGEPVRIQSMFNDRTGHPVEDNAVCTIEFANKAICISETSLVSPVTPSILEVYGTKGVVMSVDGDLRMRTFESSRALEDGGWVRPKLEESLDKPLRQFVDAVLYDKPVLFGLQEGRQLTELMEKAYIAHEEKREVLF